VLYYIENVNKIGILHNSKHKNKPINNIAMNKDEIKKLLDNAANSAEFLTSCLCPNVEIRPSEEIIFEGLNRDRRLSLIAKANKERETINIFSLSIADPRFGDCYHVEIIHLTEQSATKEYFAIGEERK